MNVYRKAYVWEEREVSSLIPGDILIDRWDTWHRDHPTAVVTGIPMPGWKVVPEKPESRDFIFVPIHILQIQRNSRDEVIYVEDDREGIYQVFPSMDHLTDVAIRERTS